MTRSTLPKNHFTAEIYKTLDLLASSVIPLIYAEIKYPALFHEWCKAFQEMEAVVSDESEKSTDIHAYRKFNLELQYLLDSYDNGAKQAHCVRGLIQEAKLLKKEDKDPAKAKKALDENFLWKQYIEDEISSTENLTTSYGHFVEMLIAFAINPISKMDSLIDYLEKRPRLVYFFSENQSSYLLLTHLFMLIIPMRPALLDMLPAYLHPISDNLEQKKFRTLITSKHPALGDMFEMTIHRIKMLAEVAGKRISATDSVADTLAVRLTAQKSADIAPEETQLGNTAAFKK